MIETRMPNFLLILAVATAPIAVASAESTAGPGFSDSEIRIGNLHPYSGPASAYGVMGEAIGAYFEKINAEGGINGRSIDYISLDDGYNPAKSKEQTRRLVEKDDVLLVFSSLGTPTNSAVRSYLNEAQVPQLFVSSGASKWGDPKHFPWTMGWSPSYRTESLIYAQYLLENVPDARIGVLYQNDDYGKDYLSGLTAGLGDRAEAMIVATESYEVTDATVHSQIITLKESGATVLLNISTPKFAAQAIRKVAELDWDPIHILNNVSTSVGAVLKPAGLDKSVGIISAQYYKDPNDPRHSEDPAYQEWLMWMERYFPDGDRLSGFNVYSYLVSQTLVHVLEQAGDDLSRENVMAQAANIEGLQLGMLLPGIEVNTSRNDYFPIEAMQVSRFNGQSWEPVGPVISVTTHEQ